jgi:uncharacterized Ntn-hydrolase superfamily protein
MGILRMAREFESFKGKAVSVLLDALSPQSEQQGDHRHDASAQAEPCKLILQIWRPRRDNGAVPD